MKNTNTKKKSYTLFHNDEIIIFVGSLENYGGFKLVEIAAILASKNGLLPVMHEVKLLLNDRNG